ncbi:MAG TPA: hypothetical protein VIO83_09190 [Pseudomonas sp.]
MRIAPVLAVALLPLLGGCQWLPWSAKQPEPAPLRLQGELTRSAGELVLQPCHQQRRLSITAEDSLGLPYAVARLQQSEQQPLFVDLAGRLQEDASGEQSRLRVNRLYRLQQGAHQGCNDAQFKRLIVRASGNEPGWAVSVSALGMMLERPGVEPLALPYVEERLPDGSLSFTSEADGRRVELWLTPGRCVDSMSGALGHLQARLQLDRQPPLMGCAALGGARD